MTLKQLVRAPCHCNTQATRTPVCKVVCLLSYFINVIFSAMMLIFSQPRVNPCVERVGRCQAPPFQAISSDFPKNSEKKKFTSFIPIILIREGVVWNVYIVDLYIQTNLRCCTTEYIKTIDYYIRISKIKKYVLPTYYMRSLQWQKK